MVVRRSIHFATLRELEYGVDMGTLLCTCVRYAVLHFDVFYAFADLELSEVRVVESSFQAKMDSKYYVIVSTRVMLCTALVVDFWLRIF